MSKIERFISFPLREINLTMASSNVKSNSSTQFKLRRKNSIATLKLEYGVNFLCLNQRAER